MIVQKTVRRHGQTLEHGAFEVRETVHACQAACRRADGKAVIRRAHELARLIPPRKVVGYDVMVYVGLQRYLHHRQREDIRVALGQEHGLDLSSGEISVLCRRFLEYLEALHLARAPALREVLAADGGWPLQVDATGEAGRGTLLIACAGWRHWTLGAWKIPSESADALLPCFREVVARFGAPCAVIRDLGRAMIPAVAALVSELPGNVSALSCHFHFLRDVGTDLLDPSHGELRSLFREFRVRPRLRSLARDLGRELGAHLDQGRAFLKAWRDDQTASHTVPEGHAGLAVTRGLAQWVLDYPADARYGTFPFDRPYLDLHDRCQQTRRAVDAFLRRPPDNRRVRRAIERLERALDPVVTDDRVAKVVATLRTRVDLFDEFRDTLRLLGTTTSGSQHSVDAQPSPETAVSELDEIETAFERWVDGLRESRPERGPAQDKREAIDVILAHIDRHGATLWGHAIKLSPAVGGIRLADRTNNGPESFFDDFRHGERRRSGRKNLAQDLECLPAAAALTKNLERHDYVAILCGSLQNLATAFADLDKQRTLGPREVLNEPAPSDRQEAPPVVGASLPRTDRQIVRAKAMTGRVQRAARSRAPRLAVPAR